MLRFESIGTRYVSRRGWLPYSTEEEWIAYVVEHRRDDDTRVVELEAVKNGIDDVTGRERLEAILHRQPADRLSWTTLVDDATLSALQESLDVRGELDFYRKIGCDIFLLNGWTTGCVFRNPTLVWPDGTAVTKREDGDEEIHETHTKSGSLRATFRRNHPIKPPVTDAKDLEVFLDLWKGARYEWFDDTAELERLNGLIGDDGLSVRFWGPSTIPQLLELDTGTENFYYLLQDEPELMNDVINTMHRKQLVAFEHLVKGPFDVIVLMENTSTTYIGPDIYRRYNGPHVRDFVDIVHAAGKTAIIHMCGHVRGLLDEIKQTGLDGIHALTPHPTGDTPWELALDVLGEEQIIIGILDPSIFITEPIENIGPALDHLYTPRIRRSNFVLWPAADGIAVPWERFRAVADWMEKNAQL